MTRYVSWLATIIFVLVVVTFSIMNGEEMTTVWPMPWSAPVYMIIFVTFFAGFVLGGIVTWFSGGRRRQRARQATERAKALARQIADLQRQHTVGAAAPLGDAEALEKRLGPAMRGAGHDMRDPHAATFRASSCPAASITRSTGSADMVVRNGSPSAETAMARGPAGPYSRASDWPNSPITGAAAAAARCIRPESLPR